VVFGPKPGVGTSVIAANLAIAMRALAPRVILLEAHHDLGNQATILGLVPERHLAHALTARLADGLVLHSSRVDVLLRSPQAEGLTIAQLHALLQQARQAAPHTVVDSAPRLDATFRALVEAADDLLMVTTPETTVLRHGERVLRRADEWGALAKLGVIVNRAESEAAVEPTRLDALFGARIVARLPSAGRLVVDAANAGRPFIVDDADHPLSRGIHALARRLVEGQPTR
jgi:Flp pilus assembly CpaE family ATPase